MKSKEDSGNVEIQILDQGTGNGSGNNIENKGSINNLVPTNGRKAGKVARNKTNEVMTREQIGISK